MILVFGKTGQVATELQRLAPKARFMGRAEADLTDPQTCARLIHDLRPEAVINAAAYTAVDKAETEEPTARLANGEAPTQMARACADLDVPLVQISTDYVFDGSGMTPFSPDHPTAPLNAYGRSKLAGEHGVRAANGTHAILRTSWVFSAHGSNFLKTMLRLGRQRERLTVVADQIGGPTPARAIAAACLRMADQLKCAPEKSGTYHFSGGPNVSWAAFARAIFDAAGLSCAVEDIPTSAYPTPATRPLNSCLDCTKTETTFGLARPDWRVAVSETIRDLEASP